MMKMMTVSLWWSPRMMRKRTLRKIRRRKKERHGKSWREKLVMLTGRRGMIQIAKRREKEGRSRHLVSLESQLDHPLDHQLDHQLDCQLDPRLDPRLDRRLDPQLDR
jgi:hypothetical protein